MTTFSILGDDNPFLHVSMQRGDKIFCESDAMVMMEANLELKGRMVGGVGRALMRQFVLSTRSTWGHDSKTRRR